MNYIVDVSDWKWKPPFLSLFVGALSGRFMKNSLCKIRDNELLNIVVCPPKTEAKAIIKWKS